MYSDKVMQEFKKPKNIGKLKNPDGIGLVGNPVCGDMLKVYIKVKKNKIINIKVETFGCVSAIATSSKATEMIKGKTIEEALKLSKEKVAKELGGLPPIKMHCSILAVDGIKKAIEDYKKNKKIIYMQ
jgi:nitrogen fixation protein NifU and related proteins